MKMPHHMLPFGLGLGMSSFTCLAMLVGCSLGPTYGSEVSNGDLDFTVVVPHFEGEALHEKLVKWSAANVLSDGSIGSWELINFRTRDNSSAPFSFYGAEYRSYSVQDQSIYNWTNYHSGYTGGCGNVVGSCPTHALIKTELVYEDGAEPVAIFTSDGLTCLLDALKDGTPAYQARSDCDVSSNGITVVFKKDD